jgi:hypothetical protein
MRFFKSWKFIFLTAVFLLLAIFYVYLLADEVKLPAKGWSNETVVDEINNSRAGDFGNVRVTTVPIPEENRFIILWNEKKSIGYVSITKDGVKSEKKELPIQLNEPSVLKGVIKDGKIDFYALNSGKLSKYIFDYKSNKISFGGLLGDQVTSFVIRDSNVFIAGDKQIRFVDGKGNSKLIDSRGSEIIDAIAVKNGMYKIAYVNNDNAGIKHMLYAELNPQNGSLKKYEFGTLIGSDNELRIDNLIIDYLDNKTYVLTSRRNLLSEFDCKRPPKDVDTRTILYTLDENNPPKVKYDFLGEINGYNPNPIRIEDNPKEIDILSTKADIKGKKTNIYNIRYFAIVKGKLETREFLTKTKDISSNPNWFKLGNDKYLEWEDITGSSKIIMFASTNPNIIKAAGKINIKDIYGVLMDTVMSQGFALTYMLLMLICFVLPTLVLAIVVSIFFMRWVESNVKTATYTAIGIHVITEIFITFYLKARKPETWALTPGIYQNAFGICLLIILVSSLSFLCMKLKFKNSKQDNSFIIQYVFFAALNIILYALLFFPYYYL